MKQRDEIHFHIFLTEMRNGKNITLEQLCQGLCSASLMARIESGERLPDKRMRDRLMERLGIVNDGYEDFLQPDEYASWQAGQELLQAVQDGEEQQAEELIRRYEQAAQSKQNGNRIERQFYLAMKAQLMQYREASEEELRRIYEEAVELTMPSLSMEKWRGCLYAAQEWNLLLEYIRFSHPYKAQAYEKLLAAIKDSAMDPYSCAKIYPKAAYFLCREWMKAPEEEWDCIRIGEVCDSAVEMLRFTERMYYLNELLEVLEQVLGMMLERRESAVSAAGTQCNVWLESRLFTKADPAMTLTRIREWRKVLTEVYNEYKMPEKMSDCCYLYWQTQNYCIGDVVRKRRKMLGLSVKELCDGICSEKTLRRLENNKTRTQMAIVGELFEKMGLSPEYQRMRIITDRYDAIVLYEKLGKALNNLELEAAGQLLEQLKKLVCMDIKINQQEIERIEILWQYRKKMITWEECVFELEKRLEYTVPLECLERAGEGYLTCGELSYIYNIAMKTKGRNKSFYMDLTQEICERYELENSIKTHINMYELMMDGVASYLGNLGQYEESSKISDCIIKNSLCIRRMNMLHLCFYNKFWNGITYKKENTSADSKLLKEKELQKCLKLASLCKDIYYEQLYLDKVKSIV